MQIRTTLLCFLAAMPLALSYLPRDAHDPAATAITNVAMFDADLHRMRHAMTVVMRGDRIVAVGPDAEVTIPRGASLIDGRGKTLLPAFVKAVVHDQGLPQIADLESGELGRFIAVRKAWQVAIAPSLSKLEAQSDAQSFERSLTLVRRLRNAGVPMIVDGDDALHEAELYERAGVARLDILYDMTLGPARLSHQDDRRGSIQRGKLADLLLIDGTPDRKIGDLRNVVLVVKNGTVVDRSL